MNNTEQKIILNAPGLVGQIAKYINEMSYKQQPILSMAAAIVATGAIYGHRLRTQSDLRTNIYMFSIAQSGSGKEGPRQGVKKLFKHLPEQFQSIECGEPASSAGLLSALQNSDGVGLFLIDEIGHFLSGINAKNAQNHTRDIMPLLTRLFTSANTTFKGLEYSNRNKDQKSRVDINQPCPCVLGSTVPDILYGAITLSDVADGFLPRWLVFESFEIAPSTNPNQRTFDNLSGPALIQKIKELTDAIDQKRTDSLSFDEPIAVLPNTKAEKLLQDFDNKMENQRIQAINNQSDMKYIYSRANEHVQKLALIACEYQNDEFVITEHAAIWAIAVVEYSINKMKIIVDKVAASPNEKDLNEMERIISHRGIMNRSEFNNYCRKWPYDRREKLLKDLVACNRVVSYTDDGKTYIKPAKM